MNASISPKTRRKALFKGTNGESIRPQNMRKALLVCGTLSSVLYAAMNVAAAMLYKGYSSVSQTVSELSAVGAPTRAFWVAMGTFYTFLFIAFAWGVRQVADGNRSLRITSNLLLVYGLVCLAWPFAPMHQREVLAAGGGTWSDTMHIVLSMVTVPLMLLSIGFGAAAFGKPFRIYSISSLVVLCFFGVLTGIDGPKVAKNLPTPWLGIWERILIAVFLLWVVVLASILIRRKVAPTIK